MARISFDTFQETAAQDTGNGNYAVKLFSLKDDGDEAVVRIMHDSVEDFDIITTHPIKLGENYRKVSCIRDPREPMDKCPLCQAGHKIQQRFFIHMIQYEKDPQTGAVVATPVVWERAAREYATKLKTLIDEYGPLSQCVFKIRRNGKKGTMDTTYEILYGNPNIYRPDIYVADKGALEGYTALGKVVLDKDYNELTQFIATGNFPQRQQPNNNVAPAAAVPEIPDAPLTTNPAVVTQQPYVAPVVPTPAETTPYQPQATPSVGGYVPTNSSAVPAPGYIPQAGAPVSTMPGTAPGARPARYY